MDRTSLKDAIDDALAGEVRELKVVHDGTVVLKLAEIYYKGKSIPFTYTDETKRSARIGSGGLRCWHKNPYKEEEYVD